VCGERNSGAAIGFSILVIVIALLVAFCLKKRYQSFAESDVSGVGPQTEEGRIKKHSSAQVPFVGPNVQVYGSEVDWGQGPLHYPDCRASIVHVQNQHGRTSVAYVQSPHSSLQSPHDSVQSSYGRASVVHVQSPHDSVQSQHGRTSVAPVQSPYGSRASVAHVQRPHGRTSVSPVQSPHGRTSVAHVQSPHGSVQSPHDSVQSSYGRASVSPVQSPYGRTSVAYVQSPHGRVSVQSQPAAHGRVSMPYGLVGQAPVVAPPRPVPVAEKDDDSDDSDVYDEDSSH
jgi:hypothetical protein